MHSSPLTTSFAIPRTFGAVVGAAAGWISTACLDSPLFGYVPSNAGGPAASSSPCTWARIASR